MPSKRETIYSVAIYLSVMIFQNGALQDFRNLENLFQLALCLVDFYAIFEENEFLTASACTKRLLQVRLFVACSSLIWKESLFIIAYSHRHNNYSNNTKRKKKHIAKTSQ